MKHSVLAPTGKASRTTDKLNEHQAKIIAASFRLLTVINDPILTNLLQLVKVKSRSPSIHIIDATYTDKGTFI